MIEKRTAGPPWFKQAVETPREDRIVEVDGAAIHYLLWGTAGRPGLIFVHGGSAHAHWWDFIAPFFQDQYQVAALDLSGMGDSGWRESYSLDQFARETIAVAADAGFDKRTVIVGHSLGGMVALKTAAMFGSELSGIVVADSPIPPPGYAWSSDPTEGAIRAKQVYPDRETTIRRFRLIPAQPCENGYILDYIASHSIHEVSGGWSWKFDDRLFRGFRIPDRDKGLDRINCRLAVIYGEQSKLFPEEIVQYMRSILGDRAPFVTMPEAHHHLFLDQPLAFVSALRAMLARDRLCDSVQKRGNPNS